MDLKNIDYTLYLCTDRDLMTTSTIEESVEQAIKGGVTVVQLREKDISTLEFLKLARRVKQITQQNNVPLIINDRIDIALAIGADGVHLGQSDMPCRIARLLLGKNKIIGVSATTLEEAIQAQKDGANYIGVGAIFPTSTKSDAKYVSTEELRRIREAVGTLPIVAIGGINENNIPELTDSVDGIAVVSAIVAQKNITDAAKNLRTIFTSGKNSNIPTR